MLGDTYSERNEVLGPIKRVGHANDYENVAFSKSINEPVLPQIDDKIPRRSADVSDFLDILGLCLKGYQSYFTLVSPGLDDSLLHFPFAWYLDEGNRIFNATTGAEYTVSKMETKIGENVARLTSSTNAKLPDKEDILLFDFDQAQSLNYIHSYPNADDVNRYYTDEEVLRNAQEGFSDTIAYRVKSTVPSEIKGTAGHSPRRMRHPEGEIDPETGLLQHVLMEQFDSLVTLQCWTKTTERSGRLARWLKAFMSRYRSIFMVNGVQYISFVRQGSEYNATRWRNDIVGTTLVYLVRTQEHTLVLGEQFKGFTASLQLLNSFTGEQVITSNNKETGE